MSNREVVVRSNGIGLAGMLFLLFLTLKLTGVISWSWWWVTAPLWGPLALVLAIALIVVLVAGFVGGFKAVVGNPRK
jgi:hypothetical protein